MHTPFLLSTVVLIAMLAATVPLLGGYMAKVFAYGPAEADLGPAPGHRFFAPIERFLHRCMGVDETKEQRWNAYAFAVLAFSAASVLFLYALQRIQGSLPGNPTGVAGASPFVAFNTAVSFVTNTNWQSYAGESTMSHLTQALGLSVQNFATAGVGICVAIALIRGLSRHQGRTLGSFWVDIIRAIVRILLPFAFIVAITYVSQGVVMNTHGNTAVTTVEGAKAVVPGGPLASMESIKQIGQNGGGFYNANSTHPFENPNGFTNLLQLWTILAIPLALCWTYGELVRDLKQGIVVLSAMLILLVTLSIVAVGAERTGNPRLTALGVDQHITATSPGGSMEGKETRFGPETCALYAVATTSTSNGSVNCAHDSLTPLAGGVALTAMMLGEVAPGGSGGGLYGMLIFAILAVFRSEEHTSELQSLV